MSGAVPAAVTGIRTVLAARTSSHTAVLVVALRGGHWPYSCGLASTIRGLAPRFSAAGAEVLLLAAEPVGRQSAIARTWRLPFRWLPEAAVEPIARELGAWHEASGRALDSLGLLGPDGGWILRQDFDNPGGAGSAEPMLAALRRARLSPVPAPVPAETIPPPPTDTAVLDPGHVARTLRRALTGAEHLAQSLPPSPAALTADRTRLRLALYLRAVEDTSTAIGSI